ncbi:hypothetical protein V6L77_22855 [Pannonibacter sp. Pt2-lr]
MSFWDSVKATWWMSIGGGAAMVFAYNYTPDLQLWLMPIALPLVLAPLLVFLTSSVLIGQAFRRLRLFVTPFEMSPEPVIADLEHTLEAGANAPATPLAAKAAQAV